VEYKKSIIKNWALEDRPREKLLCHGIQSLSDTELLAILIGSGTRNDTLARQKISSSKDVFYLFQPLLGDLPHEEFWILILNRSNQVVDKVRISQGGISGTVIDTRMILRNAIEKLASGLILCHNHPSGNTQPSEPDKKITEKIQNAANFMEINLLDHIIIADKSFFSFADEGIL